MVGPRVVTKLQPPPNTKMLPTALSLLSLLGHVVYFRQKHHYINSRASKEEIEKSVVSCTQK